MIDRLAQALALRDLTDPSAGEHAVQHVVTAIENALARAWRVPVRRDPGPRDVIDSGHVGEPHQLDLWRIRRGGPALGEEDLAAMLAIVLGAVLPGRVACRSGRQSALAGRVACRSGRQSALVTQPWHTPPSWHPYTTAGREIYVAGVEVGECGLAHPEVLPAGTTGLAMGLGLDP